MIFIYTTGKNIGIITEQSFGETKVELTEVVNKNNKTFYFNDTTYQRIHVSKKGHYKISVTCENGETKIKNIVI